ncbi:MAG TPA: T9SS type A sorting domain-containing protein, partial [Bacteroidetes bacterium]|nr:T9SS type A sorting domain-containing protein [Bacteroidota bacterium]
QIQELYIYTANGMLAEKLKIKLLPKENVINLDLSYLNQGIYFIKIPILNKTIVKKIVITNDMGFN